MSRQIVFSLLLFTLPFSAPVAHGGRGPAAGVILVAEGTCRQKCLAEQRECLAAAACTSGTAGEQKECARVCEQTYTYCIAACG